VLGAGQTLDSKPLTAKAPVIDAHMHVWSADAERFPFAHPYDAHFQPPPIVGTVELLVDEMDHFGVDHCVLVQPIYYGWQDQYLAHCLE
jgi:predicted TIM-barrel fold metal-dependent hydrolase